MSIYNLCPIQGRGGSDLIGETLTLTLQTQFIAAPVCCSLVFKFTGLVIQRTLVLTLPMLLLGP